MRLQESGEMYLETILILSKEKPSLRSIDIVEHLGYSKPSVSRAVNLLKNGGFIFHLLHLLHPEAHQWARLWAHLWAHL